MGRTAHILVAGAAGDLDGLKDGETQDFEAALHELCDLCVGACVDDDIRHDIVCLEVVEGYDHATA